MSIDKRECGWLLLVASTVPSDGICSQERCKKPRIERQAADGIEEFCLILQLSPAFHPSQVLRCDILELSDFYEQEVLPLDFPDINVLNHVPRDRRTEKPRVMKPVGPSSR